MKASILAAAALAIHSIMATAAMAADCGPLKQVNTMDLLPGPGGGPRVMVQVAVNNVPQKFLLSTAGGFSTLNAAAAKAMNLHVYDGASVRLLDAAGNASRAYVTLDTLQLGGLTAKNMDMLLTPGSTAGGNSGIDGMLAGDLMSRYDVEIDFAARKMNYFSPDHCEGKVVYWPATALAVVPFKMYHPDNTPMGQRPQFSPLQDTHIRVPVTLDGKNFLAVINTGAPNSTISAGVADRVFDVTASSTGAVPLGPASGDSKNKRFGYVFHTLSFDGITVTNPHVVVIPDLMGSKDPDNSYATGSRVQRVDDGLGPELTVGMDVLRRLHLYIAYGERKLYITPAAAAPASAAPQ